MDNRKKMDEAIKNYIIPFLKKNGFTGSYPHLRRLKNKQIDLITFQFDHHGGGFVIEISKCSSVGITTKLGEKIPPNKVRAWDMHPDKRPRIQQREGSGREDWFRYDNPTVLDSEENIFKNVAEIALKKIKNIALPYWIDK